MPFRAATRLIPVTLATAILLSLAACGKQEGTPGQKLDRAIGEAQSAASDAMRAASEADAKIKDAAQDAKQEAQAAAKDIKRNASEAAGTIGAAASDAATAVKQAASQAATAVGEALSDSAIAAHIRDDYGRDSELSTVDIGVEANAGVVTLRGNVPSKAMRIRAENLARTTKGVGSVVNEIEVPKQ